MRKQATLVNASSGTASTSVPRNRDARAKRAASLEMSREVQLVIKVVPANWRRRRAGMVALAAAATLFATAPSHAANLDFASIPINSYSSVVVGDFVFTRTQGQNIAVFRSADGSIALGDDATSQQDGSVFSLRRVDNNPFSVESIVFGLSRSTGFGVGPGGSNGPRFYVGGQPIVYVTKDNQFYTPPTALRDITSLDFDAFAYPFSIGLKSIVISAVPEAATWGMMVLGFGATGFAMRRRRKQSARVTYA